MEIVIGKDPYEKEFQQAVYEVAESVITVTIKTASIVTRCLKSLSEKEILVKNGKYIIQDLLLKKWLVLNA